MIVFPGPGPYGEGQVFFLYFIPFYVQIGIQNRYIYYYKDNYIYNNIDNIRHRQFYTLYTLRHSLGCYGILFSGLVQLSVCNFLLTCFCSQLFLTFDQTLSLLEVLFLATERILRPFTCSTSELMMFPWSCTSSIDLWFLIWLLYDETFWSVPLIHIAYFCYLHIVCYLEYFVFATYVALLLKCC